jgi:hypothetical protein
MGTRLPAVLAACGSARFCHFRSAPAMNGMEMNRRSSSTPQVVKKLSGWNCTP